MISSTEGRRPSLPGLTGLPLLTIKIAPANSEGFRRG